MKQLYTAKRFSHVLFIFAFLLSSLIIRVNLFNDPSYAEDTNNDHLIARHIAMFGEHTLIGSRSAGFPTFVHSPFYYYLLAGLVRINDSILFLGLINIFGQIVVLFFIYLIARLLFSKSTGISAMILYAFSFEGMSRASFIWAPRIMEVFLYGSLALLTAGYVKKNTTLIFLGIPLLFIGASIYNAAYAFIPALIFGVILFLLRHHATTHAYITLAMSSALSYLILYTPVYIHLYLIGSNHISNIPVIHSYHSVASFFFKLIEVAYIFFQNLFFLNEPLLVGLGKLVLILSCGMLIIFLTRPNGHRSKRYLLACFILIFQQFLFVVLINSNNVGHIARYIAAAQGLFFIALAGLLHGIFPKNIYGRILQVFCVALLILFFSRLQLGFYLTRGVFQNPFRTTRGAFQASREVAITLRKIKTMHRYNDFHFFTVAAYKNGARYTFGDALLWSPLEEHLDSKLTSISQEAFHNYVPLGRDHFMIVLCLSENYNQNPSCLQVFHQQNPQHVIEKAIFQDATSTMFLARK